MPVLDLIREVRVLPVVRRPSAVAAIELCERVLAAGSPVIELTATTPDWVRVLERVRRAAPDVVVGLGTVTSPALARQAAEAGAAFLVSPYPVAGMRTVADAAGIPFIEGGFTPAELAAAAGPGQVAKLFPAGTGGPAHLKAVVDVLPGARIIPTGGITLATAGDWLAAGAFAVGVGSDLATSPDAPARLRALRER